MGLVTDVRRHDARLPLIVMRKLVHRVPSRWTVPLQTLVVVCSAVFVVGTAIQNFVIIDEQAVVDMMRSAGTSSQLAQEQAPGFLLGFRLVGCAYIVGNALGLLARTGWRWLYWAVLLVNVTQAAGVVVIPPEVFEVTRDRFGAVGLLPSLITDGGAAILSLVLVGFLIRYRTPWACRKMPDVQSG
jgi:hypothetical protein